MNDIIPEKRNTATLWGIYSDVEAVYELIKTTLDGKLTKTVTLDNGIDVQIPFTYKEGLEFALDRLSLVLFDIDDLKRQIEVLTIHHETRDDSIYCR